LLRLRVRRCLQLIPPGFQRFKLKLELLYLGAFRRRLSLMTDSIFR
jgi:hypothetical protein